jgi:hypothetical protein
MGKDLISGSAAAVLVTILLLALGERIRLLLRIPVPPSLRSAAAWCFGSWALGLAVLFLGLAGWFGPGPLIATACLAALGGRWKGLLARMRSPASYLLAAFPLIAVALAPPFFYDAWVYHLGLPWQALREGALGAHRGNLFSSFPPLAQLIYALPLSVKAVRAPGLIHLFGVCVAAAAARSLAGRLGAAPLRAWLIGLGVLYLPVAPLSAGFPIAEAWMLSGTLTAVALALSARTARGSAAAAGWMAGIAASSRLQGLFWAALGAPLLGSRRRPVVSAAAFAAAIIAGSAPWWLKNAALLHDPLAPLGWQREGIETLWRDARSNLHLAGSPVDLFRRSWEALSARAWILAPAATAGLVGAALSGRRAARRLAGIALLGVLMWALTGALDRFLVPSLILFLIAAGCGRRRAGAMVAFSAIAWVLVGGATSALGMFRQLGGWSMTGEPAEVYRTLLVSNPYPAFVECASLPEDARVLLVAEPRGFLFPRRFETSSQHDRSILADALRDRPSPDAVVARLTEAGYTHLLVNAAEMRRLGKDYPVLPWTDAAGGNAFVALTRRLEPPILLVGEIVVYSLRTNPHAARDADLP